MKTIFQIKQEISALEVEFKNRENFKDSEIAKANSRHVFLTKCQYYLESVNPTRELLKKDIALAKKELQVIRDSYQSWCR